MAVISSDKRNGSTPGALTLCLRRGPKERSFSFIVNVTVKIVFKNPIRRVFLEIGIGFSLVECMFSLDFLKICAFFAY